MSVPVLVPTSVLISIQNGPETDQLVMYIRVSQNHVSQYVDQYHIRSLLNSYFRIFTRIFGTKNFLQ